MKIDLHASLAKWRNETSDRVKLQHVYLAIAIASVLVAGLVGLVNYDTGQQLVTLGLISLGLYLINTVVWALIDGLLLVRIDRTSRSKKLASTRKSTTTKKTSSKK